MSRRGGGASVPRVTRSPTTRICRPPWRPRPASPQRSAGAGPPPSPRVRGTGSRARKANPAASRIRGPQHVSDFTDSDADYRTEATEAAAQTGETDAVDAGANTAADDPHIDAGHGAALGGAFGGLTGLLVGLGASGNPGLWTDRRGGPAGGRAHRPAGRRRDRRARGRPARRRCATGQGGRAGRARGRWRCSTLRSKPIRSPTPQWSACCGPAAPWKYTKVKGGLRRRDTGTSSLPARRGAGGEMDRQQRERPLSHTQLGRLQLGGRAEHYQKEAFSMAATEAYCVKCRQKRESRTPSKSPCRMAARPRRASARYVGPRCSALAPLWGQRGLGGQRRSGGRRRAGPAAERAPARVQLQFQQQGELALVQ